MYKGLLFQDTVKFISLVLKDNEEKNQGKRYVGQIDLESTILSDAAPGDSEAPRQSSREQVAFASGSEARQTQATSRQPRKSA